MSEPVRKRFPRGRDTSLDARLVVIGLGSNTDGPGKINEAIEEISFRYDLLARSTRYVSPPATEGEQDERPSEAGASASETGAEAEPYSNAAVLVRTSEPHAAIKAALGGIELQLGRDRSTPESVAIDLDILLIQDQIVREGDRIVVPHPDLETRRYAAIPSAEVAPFLRHSITETRLSDLAASLA
jgi:2-amino-4-hydroxy-6-hydroxymethyldihydropteridine diphosphokinase